MVEGEEHTRLVYYTVTWLMGYYIGLWIYMHTSLCHARMWDGATRVLIMGHLCPKHGHLSTLAWCLSIWYRGHTRIRLSHCGPRGTLKLAHVRRSLALGLSVGHQCRAPSRSHGRHVRTAHSIKHTFTNKIKHSPKIKMQPKISKLTNGSSSNQVKYYNHITTLTTCSLLK